MTIGTPGQSIFAQFAPLSPKANKVIVLFTWLAVATFIFAEFITYKPICNLPSRDLQCNLANPEEPYVPSYLTTPQNLWDWDWMLLSGLVVFAMAIAFVDGIKPKFHRCVARLFDRGVLQTTALPQDAVQAQFAQGAKRWALRGALLTCAIVGLVWAFVLWTAGDKVQLPLALAEIILAFIAGGYIGEMAYFGRLGRSIRNGDLALHLDPWHADQTAGIKPVGNFYFYQATFATIPAAFLAIWIWIMPLWDTYVHWYVPYIFMLFIAIAIQTLAVFLPLCTFHVEMMKQKRKWRRMLDEEFKQNSAQRATFLDSANIDQQDALETALQRLSKRHVEVEAMPTWPIDRNLWRKFTFRNLFLLSPVVVDMALGATNVKSLVSALMGLT